MCCRLFFMAFVLHYENSLFDICIYTPTSLWWIMAALVTLCTISSYPCRYFNICLLHEIHTHRCHTSCFSDKSIRQTKYINYIVMFFYFGYTIQLINKLIKSHCPNFFNSFVSSTKLQFELNTAYSILEIDLADCIRFLLIHHVIKLTKI